MPGGFNMGTTMLVFGVLRVRTYLYVGALTDRLGLKRDKQSIYGGKERGVGRRKKEEDRC